MIVPARHMFTLLAIAVLSAGVASAGGKHDGPRPGGGKKDSAGPRIVVNPPNVPSVNVSVAPVRVAAPHIGVGALTIPGAPDVGFADVQVSAQASAFAVAVADTRTRQTILRTGGGGSISGVAGVDGVLENIAAGEAGAPLAAADAGETALVRALCIDATGRALPAAQTFAGENTPEDFVGELFRCVVGAHMRVTIAAHSFDCAEGEALWHEAGAVTCRRQRAYAQHYERDLIRRFGVGDKRIRMRDAASAPAMAMDGGVGQGLW